MTNIKNKILILLLCFCLCFSSCSKRYSSSNEEDYEEYISEVYDANLYIPKPDELGDYESLLVGRRTCNDIFFDTTETVSLIVYYSEDNFDLAVDQIENKYEFIGSSLDNYQDYEAEVNNYSFRVDSNSLAEMTCHPSGVIVLEPIQSLIIGINEEEHKIAYLYYWDIEIHEMEDLDSFIEKKFVLE